jgi:hypothetical protein
MRDRRTPDQSDAAIEGSFKVVSAVLDNIDSNDGLTAQTHPQSAQVKNSGDKGQPHNSGSTSAHTSNSLGGDEELELELDDAFDDGLGSSQVARFAPIVLPEGCTRPEAIYHLSKEIPNNEYGFPVFFFRSDMLTDLESLRQQDLDTAAVKLDYSEGYPTFGDGTPWWEQLPHEPYQSFQAFQRFIEQPEETGIRQLSILARDNAQPLALYTEWAREYYWGRRAQCHDTFVTAADKKRKEIRQRRVENQHFTHSERLISQLMVKFDDPEWVTKLEPKEAIDALERLVKLQRLSVGLSVNGNAGQYVNPVEGMSVTAVMREMTKSSINIGDEGMSDEMQKLLMGDPTFLARAQSLVIQVRRGELDAQLSRTTESQRLLGE